MTTQILEMPDFYEALYIKAPIEASLRYKFINYLLTFKLTQSSLEYDALLFFKKSSIHLFDNFQTGIEAKIACFIQLIEIQNTLPDFFFDFLSKFLSLVYDSGKSSSISNSLGLT
jgi:hypothetical protein